MFDVKIRELKAKIAQNERMRDKAYQLKPLLTDKNALSQCETEIKECQKYIDYFTEELIKIESRKDSDIPDTELSSHSTHTTVAESRDIKKYSTLGNKGEEEGRKRRGGGVMEIDALFIIRFIKNRDFVQQI